MNKLLLCTFGMIICACANLNAQSIREERVPSYQIDGVYKDTMAIRDITYKVADDQVLQFDIAYPKAEAPKDGYPLIVYFHGGAWSGGRRIEGYGFFNDEVKFYTSEGFAVASVTYRFVNGQRTIADCVVDVKDAIRFMVKNSKTLKVDPEKIGVYGHSAGGHLAFMAALADNEKFIGDPALKNVKFKIACAVPQSGPTTFINDEADFQGKPRLVDTYNARHFMGEDVMATAKLVSPAEYVSKSSPPMLIIIGEKDDIVSQNSALYIAKVAKEKGAPFEVFVAPNARHSFEDGDHVEILKKRRAFFVNHLRK